MRRAASLALAALLAGACGPASGEAQRSWPAGTVLAVDDQPITAEEIDRESVYVERIEPSASEAQLRRLTLTNIVLPRLLARAIAPESYAEARREAQTALRQLGAGEFVGPLSPDGHYGEVHAGGWRELGIVAWGVAMDLEDGQWSGLVEDVGRFFILRKLKRIDAPLPIATQVEVDVLAFPWLPVETLSADVERAHDEHHLTIVDPAWRGIVPELIQYRMGVHP